VRSTAYETLQVNSSWLGRTSRAVTVPCAGGSGHGCADWRRILLTLIGVGLTVVVVMFLASLLTKRTAGCSSGSLGGLKVANANPVGERGSPR
jgi:hypothetical protein